MKLKLIFSASFVDLLSDCSCQILCSFSSTNNTGGKLKKNNNTWMKQRAENKKFFIIILENELNFTLGKEVIQAMGPQ